MHKKSVVGEAAQEKRRIFEFLARLVEVQKSTCGHNFDHADDKSYLSGYGPDKARKLNQKQPVVKQRRFNLLAFVLQDPRFLVIVKYFGYSINQEVKG